MVISRLRRHFAGIAAIAASMIAMLMGRGVRPGVAWAADHRQQFAGLSHHATAAETLATLEFPCSVLLVAMR